MSEPSLVEARLERCQRTLGLSAEARWLLATLVALDQDTAAAEHVRTQDPHHRTGVLPWSLVLEGGIEAAGGAAPLEVAVDQLADWGLVQLVGRRVRDPVVPGSTALRLTFRGRTCVGLGPARSGAARPLSDEPLPWLVLHSTSREALELGLERRLGEGRPRAIAVRTEQGDADDLCGAVAARLCSGGAAVVDAFFATQPAEQALTRELLGRTAGAHAERVLLVRDPIYLRDLSVGQPLALEWIAPEVQLRRESIVLDERVTRRLQARGVSMAAACGVPDSDIASPKRAEARWDDLVVSSVVQSQLEQVRLHARFRLARHPSLEDIPGRARGYRLLLSGLPGTGKSLAAEALANSLGRPLVKLDLSSVLSKWLGETEKLLGQVFDVAEASDAVLLLDEAEALFRQRDSGSGGGSALSTGVAYLLTRLDRFEGLLVATTNRSRDIDEAFFRRFDDYLVLPIPDAVTRRRLWSMMLTPLAPLDQVDLDLMAERFPISGGLIRGASVRAVAWAQGLGRPLDTPVLLGSLAKELEKSDRAASEVMVEPFESQVRALLEGAPFLSPSNPK
ncbi:MAG: ATP-binding protein [Pseudomonadota bacterium]